CDDFGWNKKMTRWYILSSRSQEPKMEIRALDAFPMSSAPKMPRTELPSLSEEGAGRTAFRSGTPKYMKPGLLLCMLCMLGGGSGVAQDNSILVAVYLSLDKKQYDLRLEKNHSYTFEEREHGSWSAEKRAVTKEDRAGLAGDVLEAGTLTF